MNNMTYEKYKDSQVVKGFINHFNVNSVIKGKSHWCPRYMGRKEFQFEIKEFSESIDKYSWPSSFLAPEDSYGYFENGKEVKCESWLETKKCLQSLSKGLKKSLNLKDDGRVLQWCGAILSWGMGSAGDATLKKLIDLYNKDQLANYINGIRCLHGNESVNLVDVTQLFKNSTVSAFEKDWMSSGLSKIIALASENIIILDSRVGAILCEYINDYLNKNKKNIIPIELKFSWGKGRDSESGISVRRRPLPLENDKNHPEFKRNSSWYEQQIKASWLIRAILEENSELFKYEGGIIERIHAFEASLFMLGYNLNDTSESQYKDKLDEKPLDIINDLKVTSEDIDIEFWIKDCNNKFIEFKNNK